MSKQSASMNAANRHKNELRNYTRMLASWSHVKRCGDMKYVFHGGKAVGAVYNGDFTPVSAFIPARKLLARNIAIGLDLHSRRVIASALRHVKKNGG